MDPASGKQWKGWFSVFGDYGTNLQNIVTVALAIVITIFGVIIVGFIIKNSFELAAASGPEKRKETKVKIAYLFVAMILIVIGPTVILILMNTIYSTSLNDQPINPDDKGEEYKQIFKYSTSKIFQNNFYLPKPIYCFNLII